jgi:hypothetical protein
VGHTRGPARPRVAVEWSTSYNPPMHKKSPWLLSAVLCASACGGETTGPDFAAAQFIGTWQVDVTAASGCWEAFTLAFTVDPDDVPPTADTDNLIDIVSVWYDPANAAETSPFTGSFDWGHGAFTFMFHVGSSATLTMTGAGSNPDKVTGTFSDPSGARFPAGCSASATATHL